MFTESMVRCKYREKCLEYNEKAHNTRFSMKIKTTKHVENNIEQRLETRLDTRTVRGILTRAVMCSTQHLCVALCVCVCV